MTLFLLLLAVSARKNFSNFHRHLESHFEPGDNVKFKSLSAGHKFPFAFEYAKLNDDAVIARDKETNEIEVFSTDNQNKEPLENSYFIGRHFFKTTFYESKTTPLEASDIKLIRDFTSRCVPLDDYEFAGDFDKRTGGHEQEPQAFSYIIALNRKTEQTFGDSIDVIAFEYHEQFIHWREENPALYNEEKHKFQLFGLFPLFENMDDSIEEHILDTYIKPLQLYRTDKRAQWLKFSELSKYPQDLLQKTERNTFQEYGAVDLKNIRMMLVKNGYKYSPHSALSDTLFAELEFLLNQTNDDATAPVHPKDKNIYNN